MKTEALLNDILLDADFRESLAAQIEAEARRKRMTRAAQWLALAAAVALVAGVLLRPTHSVTPSVAAIAAEPAFVIHTLPLSDSQILATHPTPNLAFATDPSKTVPLMNDDELAHLFPKHATAIASVAHKARQFFFINPKDAQTFMPFQ